VEIKETRKPNSGRDPFPLLLKRQKLPSEWMLEGTNDRDRGVEEDCTSNMYITPENIQIGSSVTVYGRLLKIVDCDAFTRQWYKDMPAMHPEGEQGPSCRCQVPVHNPSKEQPPAYNGYGTEQDSLGSCTHLIPKVPKKNFEKFINHASEILRFKAKFKSGTCRPEHAARKFVIAYYPEDDTQSIFEIPARNSGIVGGKFLERGAYKFPGSRLYCEQDFDIGAELTFNSHAFQIYEMDKFTTKQKKGNPSK